MITPADAVTAALLCVLIVILALMGLRAWRRSRVTPEEREHRRRLVLESAGKICDGFLLEIHGRLLVYTYAVGGVEYHASQDVSPLEALLPDNLSVHGHVLLKYDPRNPGNSIVLAENWSGLEMLNAQRNSIHS